VVLVPRPLLLEQVKQEYPSLIMVDYTVPDVIHDMVALYIRHQTPFVMGTTGGDRSKLAADVKAADLYAVIAPQMGKQVSQTLPKQTHLSTSGRCTPLLLPSTLITSTHSRLSAKPWDDLLSDRNHMQLFVIQHGGLT